MINDDSRFAEYERQMAREQYSRQVADVPPEYREKCRKEKKETDFGPVYNEEAYP